MTDDLTKKLIEAASDFQFIDGDTHYANEEQINRFADHIEQAFIDAGWIKIPSAVTGEYRNDGSFDWTSKEGLFQPNGNKLDRLMTGQEWYDKFEKELEAYEYEHRGSAAGHSDHVMEAAKKASGIE